MVHSAHAACPDASMTSYIAGANGSRGFPFSQLLNNMAARPPLGGTLAPCFLVPDPPEMPTSVSVNAYLSLPLCSFGGELRRVKILYWGLCSTDSTLAACC